MLDHMPQLIDAIGLSFLLGAGGASIFLAVGLLRRFRNRRIHAHSITDARLFI